MTRRIIRTRFFLTVERLSNDDILASAFSYEVDTWNTAPILYSEDNGETWEQANSDFPVDFHVTRIIEDRNQPGRIYAYGHQPGLMVSNDYGRTWARLLNGLPINDGYSKSLWQCPTSADLYLANGLEGVFRSTNSGDSWELTGTPTGMNSYGYLKVTEDILSFSNGWITDSNGDWFQVNLPEIQDSLLAVSHVFEASDGFLYTLPYQRNFYNGETQGCRWMHSEDDGQTWELGSYVNPDTLYSYTVWANGEIYSFGGNDGGPPNHGTRIIKEDLSFFEVAFPDSSFYNRLIPVDDHLYLVSRESVYLLNDDETEWIDLEFEATEDIMYNCWLVVSDDTLYLLVNHILCPL